MDMATLSVANVLINKQMDGIYQIFVEPFIKVDDNVDDYVNKMYFHTTQHLFNTLAIFGTSPSI